MNDFYDNIQKAAYFIWEYTNCDKALDMWRCAEDTAAFLGQCGMVSASDIAKFAKEDRSSFEYISFVRHIAYRIYIYTGREDDFANWIDAEKLIGDDEFVNAISIAAKSYKII